MNVIETFAEGKRRLNVTGVKQVIVINSLFTVIDGYHMSVVIQRIAVRENVFFEQLQ